MNSEKYIGLDVNQAITSVAVLDSHWQVGSRKTARPGTRLLRPSSVFLRENPHWYRALCAAKSFLRPARIFVQY